MLNITSASPSQAPSPITCSRKGALTLSNVTFKVRHESNTSVEEAYRVLKTNLEYYGLERNLKKIVITSSGHGEGKTSTAINLGISFAKSGQKVLLIDADLQKPMLVKHLGSENFLGLTNYISGNASIEEIINPTDLENFSFIPCGPKPPNSVDIISSARFSELLKTAEQGFDRVIIDSPSAGKHIDAAIIAALTDGAIFVIKSNQLDYRHAKTARDQLEKLGGKIIGVVLNKMDRNYYKIYTNHFDDHGLARKFRKGWFRKFKGTGR